MTQVLILGRTSRGNDVCVGGVTLDGALKTVRLMLANGDSLPGNCPWAIGEIWEMAWQEPASVVPPHVENVHVTTANSLGVESNLTTWIRTNLHVADGGPEVLFDGYLGRTGDGSHYIQKPNIPRLSTGFWTPDKDLVLDQRRYYIESTNSRRRLSYVGLQPAVPTIQAGTLCRVSLAAWWKQENADPSFPERCYAQLSGWYQ